MLDKRSKRPSAGKFFGIAINDDCHIKSVKEEEEPGAAQIMLERTEGVPDSRRQCAFVCSIAAARNGKTLKTFDAEARGVLLRAAKGSNGFGYDPLFYFPELNKSFAEISREEKLRVSHRGKAFSLFLDWIDTNRLAH